jgi:tRNA modification GTPase
MQDNQEQTIVALSTPWGTSGLSVLRLSGERAKNIAKALTTKVLRPRVAHVVDVFDHSGERFDQAVALFFLGPKSYTGEDMLELQCHGSPIIIRKVIQRCCDLGARIAEPGEFTQRAFLAGKLNLLQAEAVGDLIHAQTEKAARMACRSLEGEFSKKALSISKSLVEIRTNIEAWIDFSEEDLGPREEGKIKKQIGGVLDILGQLLTECKMAIKYQHGVRLMILGPANVGKSTLLNYMVKEDVALVTDIAGTTRDIIGAQIDIGGIPVHIMDTAGIQETESKVEKLGIEKALQAAKKADLILLLFDVQKHGQEEVEEFCRKVLPKEDAEQVKTMIVGNKIDMGEVREGFWQQEDRVMISIRENINMQAMWKKIEIEISEKDQQQVAFIARERHITALKKAKGFTEEALESFLSGEGMELCAEQLRQTQTALNSLTGEFHSEDLLAEIFTTFCIGK